jgi:hypothetical protein
MTTAGDLVFKSLRRSGVLGLGQQPAAQMSADALAELNQMLAQWARRRWMVFHLVDTAKICTGAQFYTVGAGGDFDITRIDRIEAAYIRQLNVNGQQPVDFWLVPIESFEEYSRLAVKRLTANPPESFFFDSGYPLGKLYPWPIPSNGFELHILTKAALQHIANLNDVLLLPPEYEDAIDYSLRVRYRAAWRLPADPQVIGLAKAALKTVRTSNLQLDKLRMPKALSNTRGRYNIFADSGA